MGTVHLIDHPLVQHKLTMMRRKDASTNSFRRLANEISALMTYEVLRDIPMQEVEIETPLEVTTGRVIDGKKLVFVSILRAGTGILDGMLTIVPGARVGHIGLYRDPKTLVAVEYYFKMPGDLHERDVVVVDPLLATGNSAVAAVERLKECGPKSIKFVCLLTCPEALPRWTRRIPMCRSTPPPSTANSTSTATSCPASATQATASSAPNSSCGRCRWLRGEPQRECCLDLDVTQQEGALVEPLAPQPAGDLVVAFAGVAGAAGRGDVVEGVPPAARQCLYAVALQRLVGRTAIRAAAHASVSALHCSSVRSCSTLSIRRLRLRAPLALRLRLTAIATA